MPLEHGQHQAIEAKEALAISRKPDTGFDHLSNFFLLYPRLAGMTGTAKTEAEFEKTSKLETTIVPTNRVRARQDWADQVYKTEVAKWRAVANETDSQAGAACSCGNDIRGEK